MTLNRDLRAMMRLIGGAIWFLMSLAFCIEIGALIGWPLGHAWRGACIGVLSHGLCWLWLLRHPRAR